MPKPGRCVASRRQHRCRASRSCAGERPAGVYRGAIYTLVEPFNAGDTKITIDVDGTETIVRNVWFEGINSPLDARDVNTSFGFGYACTVHDAARSEWDSAVLFDEFPNCHDDRQKWIYTGLTRAANRITVIAGR